MARGADLSKPETRALSKRLAQAARGWLHLSLHALTKGCGRGSSRSSRGKSPSFRSNGEHPQKRGCSSWNHGAPTGDFVFRTENRSPFTTETTAPITRMASRDFGDFLVWNRDDIPAYELAVVVDDLAMGVTEVVRGADLLTSTVRQILIYRALNAQPPAFFHCPLLLDKDGRRLAKRNAALSLRALRAQGYSPEEVIAQTKASIPNKQKLSDFDGFVR